MCLKTYSLLKSAAVEIGQNFPLAISLLVQNLPLTNGCFSVNGEGRYTFESSRSNG